MRFKINLQIDEAFEGELEPRLLRATARVALAYAAAPTPGELTIAVTDDRALHHLNLDYLGLDAPTDVLSFPSRETDPETGRRYFGDIAISFPRARAQAEAGGHPASAEVQLLVVHAVLHLMGYDHAEPGQHARMWAAQADILERLKAPLTIPALS